MASVKLDLHEGSVLQKGIASAWRTYAVRRGIVRGLPNTDDALNIAWQHAFSTAGYRHQSLTGLPLEAIRARKFGKDKALVDLIYRYSRWGMFPPAHPTLMAEYQMGFEAVECYRTTEDAGDQVSIDDTTGMPTGELNIVDLDRAGTFGGEVYDPLREPKRWYYKRSVLKLYVPTVLVFSPYDRDYDPGPGFMSLVDLGNTVNSGDLSFGGQGLPGFLRAKSVRFDGAHVRWMDNRTYQVEYQFTITSGQWKKQVLGVDYTETPARWIVRDKDLYRNFDFAGAFPVGGAFGGWG